LKRPLTSAAATGAGLLREPLAWYSIPLSPWNEITAGKPVVLVPRAEHFPPSEACKVAEPGGVEPSHCQARPFTTSPKDSSRGPLCGSLFIYITSGQVADFTPHRRRPEASGRTGSPQSTGMDQWMVWKAQRPSTYCRTAVKTKGQPYPIPLARSRRRRMPKWVGFREPRCRRASTLLASSAVSHNARESIRPSITPVRSPGASARAPVGKVHRPRPPCPSALSWPRQSRRCKK